MNTLKGVIVFTVVEVATLVGWLVFAGVPFKGGYAAVAVLAVGIFVEHYISVNVGHGKPPLSKL